MLDGQEVSDVEGLVTEKGDLQVTLSFLFSGITVAEIKTNGWFMKELDCNLLLNFCQLKKLKLFGQYPQLQIRDWVVASNSCSGGGRLNNTISLNNQGLRVFGSNVTCKCNTTECHITHIQLKGLNLTGALPEEFANLTFLQELDLTQNYISGSIPARFAQLPLTILSLLGNRISGPIPSEIGDILTLEELVLEDNLLEGPLPSNLARPPRLRRILLSANNFSGAIPESFGNLTNLEDFGIDGSTLSGRIPSFIGNWTRITRLDMQGTSMEGPIPSTISLLTNLTELRITDLTGPSATFPNLQNMRRMIRLYLRNCLLTGSIPEYIGQMTQMKNLDLSFNMLEGQIPDSMGMMDFDTVFFNNNSLSGNVPGWAFIGTRKIDLSYNNFTQIQQENCNPSSLNLVSALSSSVTNNGNGWCMTDGLTCSRNPNRYSLFINCGGATLNFEGNEYEQDSTDEQSYFYPSDERWAYSSNGVFLNNAKAPFVTTTANVTGGDLYKTARLSPTSLRYYGLCLRKGSYKVRLHFAEIMYTDDTTFSSLGRRFFDVSIQGQLLLKDFNIREEANGTNKGIYRDFDNINVNGSTIEIHLYWAGKGTTAIPDRGVYGPLISAITITPNFDIPTDGLSAGAIAGIVIGSCAFVVLILAVLWKKGYLGAKDEDKELRGALELQTGYFSLRQIKAATNNFDAVNKIGEGGFGPVFKGILSDGSEIAVKQLSSTSKQGNREFVTEIGMISALQHPNLVKLYGCCIEGNQLLLIYEYLANNSLARALFGKDNQRLNLDWATRQKICIQVARGLAYLHEESRLKIVHRDIKATNVLLDKELNAKISDFGLAKLDEEENTHISTRVAGTIGYMAPEYAMRGYLTDKADVYSFVKD
ncbi:probable LRR receptor-like serine/threonine-protein kinase At1g53440 [Rutidosis leptorrhynchoides]|uniref:probable LRR receptor-like serine/threonine-protein kinase At1g53440 n=1 Tax=Rutidosis leptorrhynchoides TaxID=125765 RepID=UPI003A9A1F89